MLPSSLFKRHAGSLSDDEVERRIHKMIAFILNDAREKAEEIAVKAEHEAQQIQHSLLQQAEYTSLALQPTSHSLTPLRARQCDCADLHGVLCE